MFQCFDDYFFYFPGFVNTHSVSGSAGVIEVKTMELWTTTNVVTASEDYHLWPTTNIKQSQKFSPF